MRALTFVLVVASVTLTLAQGRGGGPPLAIPRATFGDGPWTIDAAEGVKIRMSVVAKGLVNPWSFAWLPDGSMLITERPGRLRLLKNGVLDPAPITVCRSSKRSVCPA
jgi:glucose/arabinose dehydrogenase